jgi:flagellar basal body P-ring formation protein FlgA
MIRIATLVAAVALATPAAAQMNIFSPSPLAAEDWVGVAPAPAAAKSFALAHEAAPPAAPQTAVPQTAASERKGPRLLPLAALAETEKAPAGPTLKREAIVTGEIVRIGDLLENAGVVAEVAIFRAPDLGQTGSVPARRVAEAVRPHQIVGLDTRGIDDVLVTRASRAISVKEIAARLIRALAAQYGLADTTDLAIAFDHEVRTLYVEPSAHAELAPSRLNYDPRSRRFDAVIELTGTAARRAPIRLMGVLTETFEAAVPLRTLAQGEIVKASDLTLTRRPKSELLTATVVTVEQAAGLIAKRALVAGKPIRQADLMKPELVTRNETVTIVFEMPGIMLTTRGKALEAGAQGDLVNVLNVQSKRTVQATVTGPGRVTVFATTPRIVATADPSNPQRKRAE